MTRCDLRTNRECSCGPNECRAAPVLRLDTINAQREDGIQTNISSGEAIFWRGCVVALVFTMITAGLMCAENRYRQIDLTNREMTHVAHR